eukprot:CAMPEP_0170272784 /NCGR_PEP_ID=MMETSP0116_2-20130129/36352_1 /TAXON_ID=400756 /ORGANISM="Durinskia baltica, Strain CSIRO CS-38" /LENGTH=40 /DNA_ID= /DNA_START= /DNA_END= /DNA_ORIENTATION=
MAFKNIPSLGKLQVQLLHLDATVAERTCPLSMKPLMAATC